MTYEQFFYWLDGYTHADLDDSEMIDKITNVLEEVKKANNPKREIFNCTLL